MSRRQLVPYWASSLVLVFFWIGQAASDEPERPASSQTCGSQVADQDATTPEKTATECDDSNPATEDKCVAGKCLSEPVVACPCASEFTAAVAAYNARPDAPLTAWLGCNDEVAGVGGLIGYATKASPAPPGSLTVILVARGRWSYGHGIARSCEAWTYDGLAGDWGRPPLGEPTHGRYSKISQKEVLACAALIRTTAVCPS